MKRKLTIKIEDMEGANMSQEIYVMEDNNLPQGLEYKIQDLVDGNITEECDLCEGSKIVAVGNDGDEKACPECCVDCEHDKVAHE